MTTTARLSHSVKSGLKASTLSLLFALALPMAATAATAGVTQQQLNREIKERETAVEDLQEQIDLLPLPYEIGETGPGGGVIFYLDEEGQRGLEAAPHDQGGATWAQNPLTRTKAYRDGINAGLYNTERISVFNGTPAQPYGAQLCSLYDGGNFGDWYLPAKAELEQLYSQRDAVGGFGSGEYWSSNEFEAVPSMGYFVNFAGGGSLLAMKSDHKNIRCIRAF